MPNPEHWHDPEYCPDCARRAFPGAAKWNGKDLVRKYECFPCGRTYTAVVNRMRPCPVKGEEE